MKLRYIFYLVLFCTISFVNAAYAQPNWSWSYPKPQGNSLHGLIVKSDNLGIAMGDNGTMLTRQNGAFNTPVYISMLPLRSGSFFVDTMWVVGDSGTIYRSINNGTSWTSKSYASISKANFYTTAARNKDNVWVAGDSGIILYSSDGANSFTKQTNSSKNRIRDLVWVKQTAYACGDSGTLLRGNSFGTTGWSKFSTSKVYAFRGIAMDTLNVFVVGDSGYVLRHDPVGQVTVRDTVLDKTVTFHDVACWENYVIAVGSNGTIKQSNDTGNTWTTPSASGSESIHHIELSPDFGTSGIAWAVGEFGIFLRSTNYGQAWSRLDSGSRNVIYAGGLSPNGTLYATGGAGYVHRSTNGGTSWKRDSIQINGARITDIAFDNNGFGLAATYDNKILRTLDSGKTWTSSTVGPGGLLFLGVAVNGSIGLASGSNGAMYRSTNKGNTWVVTTSNTARSLYDVDMWGNNAIGVGESGGAIYSINQGATWTSINSGTVARLQRVAFTGNADTAIAVAHAGTILRTANHGVSWASVASGVTNHLNDVKFRDAKHGIIVGDKGTILRTITGGTSWKIDTSHTNFDLKGGIIVSGTDAFVVGNNTTILYTTSSGLPVELLDLSAKRVGENSVTIRWNVAAETNNAGYVIDRLVNDAWREIGFEQASAGTSLRKSYTHQDNNAPASFVRYRLRQIDLDGAENILGTLNVAPFGNSNEIELAVSPIPARNSASVSFTLPAASDITLSLFDMTGKFVKQIVHAEYNSGSYVLPIGIEGLASGDYVVELKVGSSRVIKHFIVTH